MPLPQYFPDEKAFSLPSKRVEFTYESRARKLRDVVHGLDIHLEQAGAGSGAAEGEGGRGPAPYVYTAFEEFNRPLAYVVRRSDEATARADSHAGEADEHAAEEPPSFRSSCPPMVDALLDVDGEEESPLLAIGGSARASQGTPRKDTDPYSFSAPTPHAIYSIGYGPRTVQGEELQGAAAFSAQSREQQFMRHYHPCFSIEDARSTASARRDALRPLLKERPAGHTWLRFQLNSLELSAQQVEPLMVVMGLYYIDAKTERSRPVLVEETSGRVSEALHVDVATADVFRRFKRSMYHEACAPEGGAAPQSELSGRLQRELEDAAPSQRGGMTSGGEASGVDPLSEVRSGVTAVHKELKNPSLMLMIQVFKVLQGDPDRVHELYRSAKGRVNLQALEHDAQRLGRYLQPLGLAFASLYDPSGRLISAKGQENDGGAGVVRDLVVFRAKSGMDDFQLMQNVLDITAAREEEIERLSGHAVVSIRECGVSPDFPADGAVVDPQLTSMAGSAATPGHSFQVDLVRELVPFPLVKYAGGRRRTRLRAESSWAAASEGKAASQAAHAVLDAEDTPNGGAGGASAGTAGGLHELAELLQQDGTRAAEASLKTAPHASYRNLLFVQPESLEGLSHRNLAVKVELRDLGPGGGAAAAAAAAAPDAGEALPAVYNTRRGPLFVRSQVLPVTYHSRDPGLNGQVKVALPARLSASTVLFFTVYHIHVKDKNKGGARVMLRTMMTGSHGPQEDAVEVVVATGYLPLLQPHGCGELIHNGYHAVSLARSGDDSDDDDDDDPPPQQANPSAQQTLTVLVRSASSVHPQDPGLAALLAAAPPALGKLFDGGGAGAARAAAASAGPELFGYSAARLLERNERCVRNKLQRALLLCIADTSPLQSCEFLLVALRALFRILSAGTGDVRSEGWRNPTRHPRLRCQAFVLLPLLLDRASSALTRAEGAHEGTPAPFLDAYVDMLFLEEVPAAAPGAARAAAAAAPAAAGGSEVRMALDTVAEVLAARVAETVAEAVVDELVHLGSAEETERRARDAGGLHAPVASPGAGWGPRAASAARRPPARPRRSSAPWPRRRSRRCCARCGRPPAAAAPAATCTWSAAAAAAASGGRGCTRCSCRSGPPCCRCTRRRTRRPRARTARRRASGSAAGARRRGSARCRRATTRRTTRTWGRTRRTTPSTRSGRATSPRRCGRRSRTTRRCCCGCCSRV